MTPQKVIASHSLNSWLVKSLKGKRLGHVLVLMALLGVTIISHKRISGQVLRDAYPEIQREFQRQIDQATKLKNDGRLEEAQSQLQRLLLNVDKQFGSESMYVAIVLSDLATVHIKNKKPQFAEWCYQRAEKIYEKSLGQDHPEFIKFLTSFAEIYKNESQYDKAETLYQRAISIASKASSSNDALGPICLLFGELYEKKGDLKSAEPLYQRALAVSEKAKGVEHRDVVFYLETLGRLYYKTGDYQRAESFGLRALAISEKSLGQDHLDVARILHNLGVSSKNKGDLQSAEQFFQRALNILEKRLGANHPNVVPALNVLAFLYIDQADYARAEPLLRRSLTILEMIWGDGHADVAYAMRRLADVYDQKGDYERAELLYRRALAIFEKNFGSESKEVVDPLVSLAWLYFLKDNYDHRRAGPLLDRALKIAEKLHGPESPQVGNVLNQKALLYRERGDWGRAVAMLNQSIEIDEKAYGKESSNVAVGIANLALIHIAKGEYAKAEPLLLRALAIHEKNDGRNHPNVASTLTNAAYLYAAKGEIRKSVDALTRAAEISEQHVVNMLATGSEDQKNAYLAKREISNETNGAVSLHVQFAPKDPQALRLAITTILRRKGRILDVVSGSQQTLRNRLKPEDRSLLTDLANLRSRMASLVLSGPGDSNRMQYEQEVKKLEGEALQLEAQVSARSTESRVKLQPTNLAQVQQSIPENAALVEIVSYQPFNLRLQKESEMWGPWRYVAYVLRQTGTPSWIDLGESKPIDAGISQLREALQDPKRTDVKSLARALDEKVMRPVRKLLGNTRTVLLSPDGALNLVPFGALVDENNHYLVENYSFTYLTSARDLLRLQIPTASKQGAIVFANPTFDKHGNNEWASRNARPEHVTVNRRSFDIADATFPPLPGTAGEALALGKLLSGAKVLTETQATEAALKQVEAPYILHIATHGFFLADQKQNSDNTRRLVHKTDQSIEPQVALGENPLLRSGLALAGANQRQGRDGEDGILTALEASGLDLWGTKLVVLSACETGVGDVKIRDGVYGLRRAFAIAGAETLVMSLWQVSDTGTRDLMAAYYKRLLTGEGRSEALRQVQLRMLDKKVSDQNGSSRILVSTGSQSKTSKKTAAAKDRSHPYYWASFITSGNWKPLPANVAITNWQIMLPQKQ
jgi:CHAT domain-containing protein/Tfp pilus assembly protein PilF